MTVVKKPRNSYGFCWILGAIRSERNQKREFATIVGALPKALAWLAVTDPLPDKVTEPVNVLEPDKVTVPDPLAVIPPVPEITPDKV